MGKSLAALNIEMLGRFHLVYKGEVITSVNTHRLQSLLAYLVLNAGHTQSRQHLSFLFWPDSNESQARTNLRQLLHYLHSTLPDIERFLEANTKTLLWKSDADFSLDVKDFEKAVSQAREFERGHNPDREREFLERAAQLYRGDLLPGFYDEWIDAERWRLAEQRTWVLNRLVSLLQQSREYVAAIQYARYLLDLDPLRENSHQTLIRLHILNADRAAALQAYQNCVTVLSRELNVEPGPSTRRLHEQLMNLESIPIEEVPTNSRPMTSPLPLVGRQKELNQLLDIWNQVIQGHASFVLLLGEPGIGKTRLTEELVAWLGRRHNSTAYARCYAAEGHLAFAPVTQWLRSQAVLRGLAGLLPGQLSELVRVLPELQAEHPELPPPQPFTESWQRRHFFEAMANAVLKAPQPLLLVLDDIHWCDRDTIEFLHFLLRFAAQAPLLMVATARLEELGNTHPLTALLREFRREDLVSEMLLPRLNAEQTAALAAGVSSQILDKISLEHIYRESEGNPLFVIESVRAGLTAGENSAGSSDENSDPARPGGSLPPKVHAVLSSRLAQLSAPAREMVGVAATIGRAFRVELLMIASHCSEEFLAPVLDELWERRVIQRQGEDTYDFSHDKLREVAYAEIGPARKRLLHRWVGEALETIFTSELDAVSSHLARHFELAGLQARAIPYYHLAGKSSQRVYADNEAIGYLTRALELLKSMPQNKERDELELELLISLGPSLTVIQGYASSEVGHIYSRARLLCEFAEARDQYFPVLWGSWVFHLVRGELQAAKELASRLFHLAENQENPTISAAGHFTMGCTLFQLGELKTARKYFEEALARYDPEHHPFLLHAYGPELGVFCLSYLSHVSWILGNPDQALEQSASALSRAQNLAHPFSAAMALDYLALLHHFLGHHEEAKKRAKEAAALCHEYGFRYYQAWTTIIRGWTLVQADLTEEGLREIRQGLDEFEGIEASLRKPYYYTLLAQALDRAERTEEGLKVVSEAFAVIERSKECWCQAELHRTKGDLLLHIGELREAESSYQRALSLARQQEARPFELRAALSLCRLWVRQHRSSQAATLLRKTCSKFTEMDDTRDLKEAKSYLKSLSTSNPP